MARSSPDGTRATGAVVITGASSGIGLVTALMLARRGWHTFGGVRSPAAAAAIRAAAGAIGVGALLHPFLLDITETTQIEAATTLVSQTIALYHTPLLGVINNAGIAVAGPMEEVSLAHLRESWEINALGAIAVARAFLPQLRASRGRIVNVSSVSGRIAAPFLGAYAASKFALEAYSDALRVELCPWGVRVILIEPGPIATPIWEKGAARALDALIGGRASLYTPFLPAARARFARAAAHGRPPEIVAATILQALITRRPRARYLVTRDPLAFALFARFAPDWLRDRALGGAMGLREGPDRGGEGCNPHIT